MENLKKEEIKIAIKKAFEAREFSYTPYSNFKVGACLVLDDGVMVTGSNIENSSFGATNCAERTAIFKAVSDGKYNFKYIVVVGGKADDKIFDYCPPCGICRQVMTEFCDVNNFFVILAKSEEEYKIFTLNDILPLSFTKSNM